MKGFRRFLVRLAAVITRRKDEARLREEIEEHLAQQTAENLRAGMQPDAARRQAVLKFGAVEAVKESYRDQRGVPFVENLIRDIRHALKGLRRTPGFTVVAVLTLALGIAVTNTVFSIINIVIIRDVPFDQPDRLISLTTRDAGGRSSAVSYLDFLDWRASARTLTDIAAASATTMSLSEEGSAPHRILGGYVSANAFRLLGEEPTLGRDFLTDDDRPGAALVVILNHSLWQTRYGGDRTVLGRSVRVNGVPATVIGVMPPGFRFPFSQDLWLPLSASPAPSAQRNIRNLFVFARMAASVTRAQVQTDVDVVAHRLTREYPDTNRDIRPVVEVMKGQIVESSKPILTTFMAMVGLVLLIACANVANLLLSRSAHRSREFAIRASLGATRWHIVRQLLIECTVLAVLAGVIGLILSVYGVKFLGTALDFGEMGAPVSEWRSPYWVDLGMDATVYLFVAVVCVCAGLFTGMVPALQGSRANSVDSLKSGGRGVAGTPGARRWASTFMVLQISLSLVLLTQAGLFVRSFLNLYFADRVVDTSDVVTARFTLPTQKYPGSGERGRFLEELERRLSAASAFSSITMSSDTPFAFTTGQRTLSVVGRTDATHAAPMPVLLAGRRYFETLALPVVRGRALQPQDESIGQRGAVINQGLAALFFPDRDPIGQRITLSGFDSELTIVGVSRTIPLSSPPPGQNQDALVYVPLLGADLPRTISLIVRSPASLTAVAATLREELHAVDPDVPLYFVQTLDQVLANNRYAVRFSGSWFGMLAVIAVLLASVGLYALTAQAVAQRTQEVGVRMALGADSSQVVRLFLSRSVVQLSVGVALGLAGALAAGRLIQNLLVRTDPRDPLTLAAVTVLLVVVTGCATVLSARRAARVDPLVALRYD